MCAQATLMFATPSVTIAKGFSGPEVIDYRFQLISNVGASVSVVLCDYALLYRLMGGNNVVDNSLSQHT